MLQLPGGSESQQVMLQVRFAEVNRRALDGSSASTSSPTARTGSAARRRSSSRRPTSTNVDGRAIGPDRCSADFLNLFFFSATRASAASSKALKQKGYFQSLAEPNLIAYNGQEASFLAGGEFPVPFVQGAAGTVTVEFKEFGVRLKFKPTIAGDVIRLKVQARGQLARLQQRHHALRASGFRR